jgi:hypothetical protein
MKPKHFYLALCFPGFLLPYFQFLPFLQEHGLNMRSFFHQLFANPVSAFFGMDVILSSIVLWLFIYFEGSRFDIRRLWLPLAASLTVGVSLALPLFLYMREVRLERLENAEPVTAA